MDLPSTEYKPLNREEGKASSSQESKELKVKTENLNTSTSGSPQTTPRAASSSLLAQRIFFDESQIGRTSFHKLPEPSLFQRPGIAPYRIIIRDVKEKLARTRTRLELQLDNCPCEQDPCDFYETSSQLLEPLLLCYDSLQSCGSGVIADGRLPHLNVPCYRRQKIYLISCEVCRGREYGFTERQFS
ncbi:hypothetical protein POM88_024887 [Heracleum sosnowskyi]|uniref:Uncharacterized protein n=1 Tax=Heracleum sosnowskyi TaxID=360622 RepID=A0AAD8I3P4_9APIA|nr:hypothetical protein POM88_024887 [Heracleum sosnowskyi]